METSLQKKIFFAGLTVAIVALTSLVFYKTQPFYMLFAKGQVLIRAGEFRKAQDVLLEALALAPNDIRTVQYIFLADEKLKSDRGTRLAYEIIDKADVENAPFSLYVADRFYSDAYYEKAERIYKKILSGDKRLSIKEKLAEVLLWQKKYDESIVLLDALVKESPQDDRLRLLLANANFWAQHYERAVELYRPLLESGVRTDEMVLNLAEALRLTGQDEEAVKVYETFLQAK